MSAQLRRQGSLPFLLRGFLSFLGGLLLLERERTSFVRFARLRECLRASLREYAAGFREEVPLREREAFWWLSLALLQGHFISLSCEGVPLQEREEVRRQRLRGDRLV